MGNAPPIWLDYRPIRVGWVVDARDILQLETAASWSTCLWGGRFNPIIPVYDHDLSENLIQVFGVDVLVPVVSSEPAKAFVASYPHLHLTIWGDGIFKEKRCEFVDIRHTVRRASGQLGIQGKADLTSFVRPIWLNEDELSVLFAVLFGRYPTREEITLNYVAGIRSSVAMPDKPLDKESEVPADLAGLISPLTFTSLGLSWRRERSGWLNPGIVLGDATNFDDLLLLWNLQAAGTAMCFYDQSKATRLKPFLTAFLAAVREHPAEERTRINFWGRGLESPWNPSSIDLDLSSLQPYVCGGGDAITWNRMNLNPIRPQFSTWHRDVIASYTEADGTARASFALPDRPFDDEDTQAINQQFVVTVDARQYGWTSDDLTFETPYVPRLNEFYGRNFHFEYDKARAEPGSFGHGAVGFIATVANQRLEARAYRVQDWLRSFFELLGIAVERSEPGLRAARLIRQFGGLQASRVLKVRGAHELIRKYGPDRSFTRSEAEKCIGNFDESTKQMRFGDFENLYIQRRERGKLTPGEVLQYMTARGVFRVGLEFKCPTCELRSWAHLDDVKTMSTCVYCGQQFDVTSQLKDRDWRYRRSGLFGRDDNQLGGIPVALALQQLEIALHDSLQMWSTALNFTPIGSTNIEKCEADFVAVIAGAPGAGESPVQILLGEAKTHTDFDAEDVRKLGKLADAIPHDLAQAFVMFAKTDAFTPDEIAMAKTLNSRYRQRVILWSRDELEPYFVYERSAERLGQLRYAVALTDMVRATEQLWFRIEPA
jgi:hypothetical protein